ncbi:MAG: HD-GYP domain-containing protein [Magnetococcus sp. WYHC-3]
MLKKIPVQSLIPGMVVSSLVGDPDHWHEPRLPLTIQTQADVDRLRTLGVRDVYIDASLGADLPEAVPRADVVQDLERQLAELGESEGSSATRDEEVMERLTRNLTDAQALRSQAEQAILKLMEQSRLGRRIDAVLVRATAQEMERSLRRDRDLLTSLVLLGSTDSTVYAHSVNVGVLMMAFSQTLDLPADVAVELGVGGMLHDLGMARIDSSMRDKPGKLSPAEYQRVREHVALGLDVLSQSASMDPRAVTVMAQHHERQDGLGYPQGLDGAEIHEYGRMAAIVDTFEALTSHRPYRSAIPSFVAVRRMLEWSAHHFDAGLYKHFVRTVGIYPVGTLVRLGNGVVGVVLKNSPDQLLYPVLRVVGDPRSVTAVSPYLLDLSRYRDDPDMRIEGCELPGRWNLNPARFLFGLL